MRRMTAEEIECCRRIGRDEVERRASMGLAELDALCDTALLAAERGGATPARRSEADITADINHLEARLAELYHERRGRMVEPGPPVGEDGDLLGPAWGWCANCGRVLVDAAQGDDTCRECAESA